MIEVYVKYPGIVLPKVGMYYVVAKNGFLLRIENDWVDATIPIERPQTLEEETVRAELKVRPISAVVIAKTLLYFKRVFDEHRSEAAVLLHYSDGLGWEVTAPKQDVSSAHVKYEMTERLPGYRCIGTMHSHGSMSAGHSHTDVADEASFDGVHITLGSFCDFPTFTMDAEIVVRGKRFPLGLRYLEGVCNAEVSPIDAKESTSQVAEEKPGYANWLVPYLRSNKREMKYVADLSVCDDWQIPEEWLTNIKSHTYYSRSRKTATESGVPLRVVVQLTNQWEEKIIVIPQEK